MAIEKVWYFRARCPACGWTGGDMLFRVESLEEFKRHESECRMKEEAQPAPTGDGEQR